MRFLHLRLIYACTCSLLIGLIQIPGCSDQSTKLIGTNSLSAQPPVILSGQQVCELAKSITVIIMSADGKSEGTGFLIHQKPDDNRRGFFLYKVVTNAHVVTKEDDYSYNIQTPDGAIHQARQFFRFGEASSGNDLAILQFQSDKSDYEIAKLAHGLSLVPNQDQVIAAGFPIRTGAATESEWVCTEPGEVSFVLQTPIRGGYEIGYFLDIRKGMSGGPLLNLRGEVVGINGRHSHPPFGASRIYTDENGNPVNEPLDLLRDSSWAIPMDTLVPLAISKGIPIAYTPNQPQPIDVSSRQDFSNPNQPGNISHNPAPTIEPEDSNFSCQPSDYQNVEQIAQKISVKVLIGNNHQRSGIIIEQQGQNYKVLTYEGQLPDGYYWIQTNDGEKIPATHSKTILYEGNKLVVLEFRSQDTAYEVASPADSSSLTVGEQVFAAGYLWVSDSSQPSGFQFQRGQIERLPKRNERLAVSNSIDEGFLGGPLLNCQGKVIGIFDRHSYSGAGWNIPSDEEPEYKYSWATPIEKIYSQLTESNANSYTN
jgi:S1-C subfamily serine protease